MKYIECPQEYEKGNDISLFLAGGISGCHNWQQKFKEYFQDTSLTLLNPRRKDFDVTNPSIEVEQIEWEHRHLEKSDIVSFWFPPETLCPITLFELGKYCKSNKPLFVGTDAEYKRRRDVIIQMGLVRPQLVICSSLEEMSQQVKKYISNIF